ncbi:podocan isoform X4 [Halyomorpha halys]|uniref:podocan isoform X4 n=1 Tax=Halyomorpha halys TaxID=286706 RepID=UPI0006D505AC|nr:toll-like receptor 6 isoform X4 [Halyomorpha halys]XP_014280648.1 toll-like receptor 6 isoform X4 [Halyomorpha halys]
MTCWKVAYLLVVLVVRLAQPSCNLCNQKCYDISTADSNYIIADSNDITTPNSNVNEILIECEEADNNVLVSFIEKHNFTNLQRLTLRSPILLTLNLTKFYNVSNLNLSENNITYINLSQFHNIKFVNLSHNSINKFIDVISNLTQLDLSYNLIEDLSENVSKLNKLSHLYVRNNQISSITNFSSTSLKFLDASENKIEKLTIGNSPSLRQLTLSNNLIKTIQPKLYNVIPNLEILNLSSNFLTKLEDHSFNLTNLLQLDLNNNEISSLSQKCFSGLSRLQVLNISLNRIQTVSPSTFQYLNGLFHLVVSENKELSSQDFGLLLATRRLKSVYASKTNQNKIPSSLTRSVRYLVLSFNNISQIECGDLDSYPLLNSLNLANNMISYIEDDALGRLELLTSINLDHNHLETVPHTLPNNLKYLFLQNNKIKSINNNDFTGLQQLVQLDLSFNLIYELKDSSFSQLYGLEKLNLSGNFINTFPINSFSNLQNLKILDLSYLSNVTECNQALCFPVPDHNQLQELYMKNSSVLVNIFLKDVAAQKTFEQLSILDVSNSNITFMKRDFSTYLSRLTKLNIQGNKINCSSIEQIFAWFHLKEEERCIFIISEDHPVDQSLNTTTTTIKPILLSTKGKSKKLEPTEISTTTTEDKAVTKEYQNYDNKTDNYNAVMDPDLISNELWFKNGSHAIVDAYSSETPTSHPGLFVLLLLPIAVVSACLFLNYSRIKRNTNNPINIEMDIEISNISSELW